MRGLCRIAIWRTEELKDLRQRTNPALGIRMRLWPGMNSLEPHRNQPRLSRAEDIVDWVISNEHRVSSQAAHLFQRTPEYSWIRFLAPNDLTDDNSRKVLADLQLRDLRGLGQFGPVGDNT